MGEQAKKNTWQAWAAFLYKYMPRPGKYTAQVLAVRGAKLTIQLRDRKTEKVYFVYGELAYGKEEYDALPHDSDD